ncbi:carbohydrate ABC transporter membrane protein 1 (CUT1 family) [Homoserinimonas aerilata]|uniref:Maltose/maltodextrin transport system permease protein n=1 Tax=Homoserinimonas aerilata TaxID=1162970 RepID=A0A542YA88_9MICO|nr:ABC transporter permease subunit [Homoserinimonas aerilata]TQL45018.1 carbohydrate ABC transporter membrane protein 1 (CUT1 family) [Homoserinimonas aerilata]
MTDRVVQTSKRSKQAARIADAASGGIRMILLKIVLLGIVDAIAVYALFVLALSDEWLIASLVAVVTLVVNWIYFSKRKLPAKYLTPGVLFLIVFQIFVIGYTGYIGFTNYSTGHNSDKAQAIDALMSSARERVPDSPTYKVTIVENLEGLGMLVTAPDGEVSVGSSEHPLSSVRNATMDGDKAVAVDGYTSLSFQDVLQRQGDIVGLEVPFSDDPNDGSLRTPDGSSAYVYTSSLVYDEQAGTMTDASSGTVYSDTGTGAFTSSDGEELLPGWRITVGFDNFARAFTEDSIREPLINVTIWTIVFALLSVASTFFLGLFLAIVFNDKRMKGRKFYRIAMILPYAFPAFLSALVWAGMLSESFGFVNQVLLGGASIPWLTDPFLAKVSILFVNLWLGFPYMFLVATGALQSIPDDVVEAATVDGAKPWQVFRLIKMPLLLVTMAPILISSFAFNFNNFNLIYMLTGGGPRDAAASVNVGATDILISMVYKVAFTGQLRDYGLASAFTIIIFILVATISIVSFRQTKALEELN